MLAALAWALLGLGLVLIVLGATPVLCEFRISRDPELRFRVLVRLLGGLTPSMAISDSRRPKKPKKDKPAKAHRRSRGSGFTGPGFGALVDLVSGLVGTVHINRLCIDGRFGTGDPAETGQIYGHMMPVMYGLAPAWSRVDITLVPVFDAPCLDGHMSGEVRITPFALLPPVARFGWQMVRR